MTNIKAPATQFLKTPATPLQPVAKPTLDEQIRDLIRAKHIPHIAIEVNAEGHIIVDKDKDPELYDWAVNG